MSEPKDPVIVVSAYNRDHCLLRLLNALEQADYVGHQVTLVISIDKSDNEQVLQIADAFQWSHGTKRVIKHQQRLDMRGHILSCGDLTEEYGSIILFEDDLFVSKYFYQYSVKALQAYHADERVAGISLYSYDIAEIGFNPFSPVDDGNEVYFMQVASSWGQAWTNTQWRAFRKWFADHPEMTRQEQPPVYLFKWSHNSWKKHFIRYLHFTEKYFVFPRHSLSTNFEELGNTAMKKGLYQVPIQQGKREYRFVDIEQSRAVYDAYFEMKPACLKKWNRQLDPYDFTTDIYGNHPLNYCKTPYLLTTKPAKEPVLTYGLEMIPPVLNVINQIKGDTIKVVEVKNVLGDAVPKDLSYFKYKGISEIIFEEELNKRVELVYAANSKAEKALHHDYTTRIEALNEQIRNLDKAYNVKIADLHRHYGEKQKEAVEQALKDFQFSLDYPAFAIVTIAKSDDLDAALKTVRSVQQQDYPRLQHKLIVVGNSSDERFAGFPEPAFSLQFASDAVEALQMAESHLNQQGNDFHCWLEAGVALLPKALLTVRDIFKRFVEVNWLKGMPARAGSNNETIPATNGVDYRWDKNRFYAASLSELSNKLSRSGIFWKKHLWQKAGGNFNKSYPHTADVELFAQMYNTDLLYVAMAYLATESAVPYTPSSTAEQEFAAWRKNAPATGAVNSFISALSKPFFTRDIPFLRAIHKSRNSYPPLIRFDYSSQSFYLSEY